MTRPVPLRLLVALLALVAAASNAPAAEAPDPSVLVGTWQVDLRPTPDAEPYFQTFVVTAAGADTLAGSFYGTEIGEGRINTDWGALHLAFVTGDGSGAYNTSAVLDGDVLRGTTHSLGRDFLAVWTARRQ
ncbi:hypothetical protein KDM41_09470 [bacterium]|nr:hypothetical protein [bacterium]